MFSVVYTCVSFLKACIAFCCTWMTSPMHIKKGLVISDWYFGERMETNSAGEKGEKRKE